MTSMLIIPGLHFKPNLTSDRQRSCSSWLDDTHWEDYRRGYDHNLPSKKRKHSLKFHSSGLYGGLVLIPWDDNSIESPPPSILSLCNCSAPSIPIRNLNLRAHFSALSLVSLYIRSI